MAKLKRPFNLNTLASVTKNPMLDVGYQCADMVPFFKFTNDSAAYYTRLNPIHCTSATKVKIYTKTTKFVEGIAYDYMQYSGVGSQNGTTLIRGAATFLFDALNTENIRGFRINKWAKYKPFRYNAVRFASQSACDAARASVFQGFDSAKLCVEMTPDTKGTFDAYVYTYLPPRGTDNEWFRLMDFIDMGDPSKAYSDMGDPSKAYSDMAVPPMLIDFSTGYLKYDKYFVVQFSINPSAIMGYDSNTCISVEELFGSPTTPNGPYDYCPSVIVRNAEVNGLDCIVLSCGQTLSEIDDTASRIGIVSFMPMNIPWFQSRRGKKFEVIACLTNLVASTGTETDTGTTCCKCYYGAANVLHGARSLEFYDGYSKKTFTMEDISAKNQDGLSLSVGSFTMVKDGTSTMSGYTDCRFTSDVVINYTASSSYDNSYFEVEINMLSNSGLFLKDGSNYTPLYLYTTKTEACSAGKSGKITIPLTGVIVAAPTTSATLKLNIKAVVGNPNSKTGQTTISATSATVSVTL